MESRKVFQTLELLDSGPRLSLQNLELLGVIGKILFSKNLGLSLVSSPESRDAAEFLGADAALYASRRFHHGKLGLWKTRSDVTSGCGKVLGEQWTWAQEFSSCVEIGAGVWSLKSLAVGRTAPTFRKLREGWGTLSIGEIGEIQRLRHPSTPQSWSRRQNQRPGHAL